MSNDFDQYLLRIYNRDEYIMEEHPLVTFEYIQEKLQNGEQVKLVLVPAESAGIIMGSTEDELMDKTDMVLQYIENF